MHSQSALPIFALLISARNTFASYAYPASTAGAVYSGTAWSPTCFDGPALCFDGCAANIDFVPEASSFTYNFPSPSTTWQWWGYQTTGAGLAQVCFDDATDSACDIVNYFNASVIIGLSSPALFYTKTGLTDALHKVTVTNIQDTNNGGQYGALSADHFVIDGGVPVFAEDSTIFNVPTLDITDGGGYLHSAALILGASTAPLTMLIDCGGQDGYVAWIGCTDPNCDGHNRYTPGPSYVNFTASEELCYEGVGFNPGDDCIFGWKGNDTLVWDSLTTPMTIDAIYSTNVDQPTDGNLGVAKSYWYGGRCVGYVGFVEQAYAAGKIKNPVLSWYIVAPEDNAASGVSSVAQLGGVDTNKYTGEIDWVPMDASWRWQSPSQVRTIRATTDGPEVPFTWSGDSILFDTGHPHFFSPPPDDWAQLTIALQAIQDFENDGGAWFFPCDSTLTLMMHGSQSREYVIPLADPTQPYSQVEGYCLATGNDEGPGNTFFLLGELFLIRYYSVHHYQANLLGFATKNVGASAATTSVLTGSG